MSNLKTLRARKDIKYSDTIDPLTTLTANVKDTFQNITSGEIFTCFNISGADREWIGTQGTVVTSTPTILAFDHPNLVAMYTMDNISGSTLVDESPNGHDGVITGMASVAGVLGNALDAPSASWSNHRIRVDNVLPTSGFAISFWFKSTNNSSHYTVIGLGGTEDNYVYNGWQVLQYASGFPIVVSKDGSGTAVDDSASTLDAEVGVWNHIVFNCPAASGQQMQAFLAGVLKSDVTTTVNVTVSQRDIVILGSWSSGNYAGAVGAIDHLRIFDRSLTQQEITALYNEGTP